jgi:hypothetical protein
MISSSSSEFASMTRGGGKASLQIFKRISTGNWAKSSNDVGFGSDAGRNLLMEPAFDLWISEAWLARYFCSLLHRYTNILIVKMGCRPSYVD